jgi:hypothetical protein
VPSEGTAARLNNDGISLVVVATVPSFTHLWVSDKVLAPHNALNLSSGTRACSTPD